MTSQTRLERTLPGILDDLAAGPTPEYLDDVFARTDRMQQRPGWAFPERWLPMADITRSRAFAPSPPWRLIALALVVIALVAGALLYAGSRRQVPEPFGPARNGVIPFVSGGDIYVGDPTTGATRLIVGGRDDDAGPSFSADGTRMAFTRTVGHTVGDVAAPVDLYTVRDDGTGLTKVTPTPITDIVAATWTPDGRQLAVVHPVDGVNQLDLYDTDAPKAPHRLPAAAGIDSIEFSPPTGDQILFRALVDGRFGLFTINADGSNLHTLFTPTNTADLDRDLSDAVYSADGDRIFFQRWFPDSLQLWVMDRDGADQHRFVDEAGATWDGIARVSPDGRWVAFWHVFDGRATQRLSVVRADGAGPIIQTGPELPGNADWVWAPDSSKILMIPVGSSNPSSAYLLDPTGGSATQVPWTSDLDLDWQRLAP